MYNQTIKSIQQPAAPLATGRRVTAIEVAEKSSFTRHNFLYDVLTGRVRIHNTTVDVVGFRCQDEEIHELGGIEWYVIGADDWGTIPQGQMQLFRPSIGDMNKTIEVIRLNWLEARTQSVSQTDPYASLMKYRFQIINTLIHIMRLKEWPKAPYSQDYIMEHSGFLRFYLTKGKKLNIELTAEGISWVDEFTKHANGNGDDEWSDAARVYNSFFEKDEGYDSLTTLLDTCDVSAMYELLEPILGNTSINFEEDGGIWSFWYGFEEDMVFDEEKQRSIDVYLAQTNDVQIWSNQHNYALCGSSPFAALGRGQKFTMPLIADNAHQAINAGYIIHNTATCPECGTKYVTPETLVDFEPDWDEVGHCPKGCGMPMLFYPTLLIGNSDES